MSFDGGVNWRNSVAPPFTRCAGGNARNGGDYERASDPWVSFAPDGTAYFMALAVNDSDATNAMLVARSRDGGRTWGPITLLIKDKDEGFNDKNSLTADPTDSRYAYAVWDRLSGDLSNPGGVPLTSPGPRMVGRPGSRPEQSTTRAPTA